MMRAQMAFAIIMLAAAQFATFTYLGAIEPANPVSFGSPVGLAYANGRLYVADADKDFVFIMNADGTIFRRLGGMGYEDLALNTPEHMMYDGSLLYIADKDNDLVKIYDNTSFAGKLGQGINELAEPTGASAYGQKVYVTDGATDRIFIFDRATKVFIDTFGTAGQMDRQMDSPQNVFTKDGLIYVADKGNDRISVYDLNFTPVRTIGRGEGGVSIRQPEDVFVSDLVYVADTGNNRIAVFSKDGYPLDTFSGSSANNSTFSEPRGILVVNDTLYVADTGNHRVLAFRIDTSTLGQDVTDAIAGANRSVEAFLQLAAVGNRINVSVESSATVLLSQASALYSQGNLADAKSLALQADAEAQRAQAELGQRIETQVRSIVEGASEKLALYENRSLDSATRLELVSAKNKAADALNRLDAKDYAQAADEALAAQAAADSIANAYAAETEKKQESDQNAMKSAIEANLNALRAELDSLEQSAADYNTSGQFDYAESLLGSANASLASGNLLDANASIPFIEQEIAKANGSLNSSLTGVQEALAQINATDAELASIAKSGILIAPNLQAERLTLAAAKEKVYSDPVAAKQEAAQALEAARQEGGNARLFSVAIIVLAAFIVAFFVALAVGVFLYLRRKKRKGV